MGIIEQVRQMKIEAAKEEGLIKGRTEVASSLIAETKFSDKKIAAIVRLSEASVKKLRKKAN